MSGDWAGMVERGLYDDRNTWVTRDGTEMLMCDMTERHINNALRMLERSREAAHDEASAAYSYSGNGDAACYAANAAGDRAFALISEINATIHALRSELERRQ